MSAERYLMLDVWMSLGGDSLAFEGWMDDPRRTPADAWAQLMAAVGGNRAALEADTNPRRGGRLSGWRPQVVAAAP